MTTRTTEEVCTFGDAQVYRVARGKYTVYFRGDKPVVSRISAEEMMRLIASYARCDK